jgi:site-specific recombinase XerD
MVQDLKVSFYLKKDEIDSAGKAPVMGRIRVGKTEAPFSAREKISVSLWDIRSGRASGKSHEATKLNRKLDDMNVAVNARYRERLQAGETVSAVQLKAAFQGITSNQSTLIRYFEGYIQEYEKRVGKDRQEDTFKALINAKRHLVRFLKSNRNMQDIPFSALNCSFVEDYDYYLRVKRRLACSTILGLITQLRRMIKYAMNEGILSADPFFGYKPVHPKETKKKYLTLAELESIINSNFTDASLNTVKDMFLFSCFTGLAYSDMCNLKDDNLFTAPDGVLWILTSRQKTGVASHIPLLEIPLRIIEKYRGTSSKGRLLPMTGNAATNKKLKIIATHCGIEQNLIFHSARHTYASTVTLSQGVPVESVSSMLGHKHLRTTSIYAKVTDERIGADMAALELRIPDRYQLTQTEPAS